MEIRIEGKVLQISKNFSVDIEDTNPIYNDIGSQSLPVTVPATAGNLGILGFPTRIDSGYAPDCPMKTANFSHGSYMRTGLVNVISADSKEGISFNIGFDNSTAYTSWTEKNLSELDSLPVILPEALGFDAGPRGLMDYFTQIYIGANPKTDRFAVFPLAIAKNTIENDGESKVFWEVLNIPYDKSGHMRQPLQINRLIDGTITQVTVPEAYCTAPFVRVWSLIDWAFADLGIELEQNIFQNDDDLCNLVVLHNCADAACTGILKVADLVPDCTVAEFLNALFTRFGVVYNINYNTGFASLELLKDIIDKPSAGELLTFSSATPIITYETPKYVKLSADTSLEGAEPPAERFEDFAKGLETSRIHIGADVGEWTFNDNGQNGGGWTGDVRDDYWDDYDPDSPDIDLPDNDRDDYDDRDYDLLNVSATIEASEESFLAKEFITGKWYKLDSQNRNITDSGSSFFNWDPKTAGMEAVEYSACDKCVPVGRVNNTGSGTGTTFNDICPLFITGARHYHSFIKASENDENSTPLAFALAYTLKEGRTVGRITPETETGMPVSLKNGVCPKLSLIFQFSDGLFAKFWTKYDEILRHGNRSLEVNMRMPLMQIQKLEMFRPYTFNGIRVLIDSFSYSLPCEELVDVEMKLRTIMTFGEYNIKQEQNIPAFSSGSRTLTWKLLDETFGSGLSTMETRTEAVRKFIDNTGYTPHGVQGDYWHVNYQGAIIESIGRVLPTWSSDTGLSRPTAFGQIITRTYFALLHYNIYEIHDISTDAPMEDYELGEVPIGKIVISVPYTVKLVAVWEI